MAATMVATPVATAKADASTKTLSFTTGRAVPYGSTLFICVAASSSTAAPTFTISAAGGLTWAQDATSFVVSVAQSVVFSAPVTLTAGLPSGTTLTVTVAASDAALARWAGAVMEASSVLQAAYVDRVATATGGSTSKAPSVADTIATAQADELLLGVFATPANPVFTGTTPAGVAWTTVASAGASANKQVIVAHKPLSATGVQTVGGTTDIQATWQGCLVTYKGGAPPTPPPEVQAVVSGAVATNHLDAAAKKITLTTTRDVPAGSSLVLALGCSAVAVLSNFTVSDSRGASWRLDAKEEITSNVLVAVLSAPLVARLVSGSVVTVTCDQSLARWSATLMEITGTQQAAGYVDRVVTATGGTASTTPSVVDTVATAQANEIVFGAFALPATPVFTEGAGYTLNPGAASTAATANKQVALEHKVLTSIGTQTANGTLDTSAAWAGVLVTYKAGDPLPQSTGEWVLRSGRLVIVPQQQVLRSGSLR